MDSSELGSIRWHFIWIRQMWASFLQCGYTHCMLESFKWCVDCWMHSFGIHLVFYYSDKGYLKSWQNLYSHELFTVYRFYWSAMFSLWVHVLFVKCVYSSVLFRLELSLHLCGGEALSSCINSTFPGESLNCVWTSFNPTLPKSRRLRPMRESVTPSN